MAFSLGRLDPGAMSGALGQAIANKRAQGETASDFPYTGGVPGQRFAGQQLEGLGLGGEFGVMASRAASEQGRKGKAEVYPIAEFMKQYLVFTPLAAQPPSGGGQSGPGQSNKSKEVA